MSLKLFFVSALLFLASARSMAASSLDYELYDLDKGRVLLSKGIRHYSPTDAVIRTGWILTDRELPVTDGFYINVSESRDHDLSGFALQLRNHRDFWTSPGSGGFSWDWFYRESGDTYRKLQEGGRVRIHIDHTSGVDEIDEVEVLEDISLRVNSRPLFYDPRGDLRDTQSLVLRKGSVVSFIGARRIQSKWIWPILVIAFIVLSGLQIRNHRFHDKQERRGNALLTITALQLCIVLLCSVVVSGHLHILNFWGPVCAVLIFLLYRSNKARCSHTSA